MSINGGMLEWTISISDDTRKGGENLYSEEDVGT